MEKTLWLNLIWIGIVFLLIKYFTTIINLKNKQIEKYERMLFHRIRKMEELNDN